MFLNLPSFQKKIYDDDNYVYLFFICIVSICMNKYILQSEEATPSRGWLEYSSCCGKQSRQEKKQYIQNKCKNVILVPTTKASSLFSKWFDLDDYCTAGSKLIVCHFPFPFAWHQCLDFDPILIGIETHKK